MRLIDADRFLGELLSDFEHDYNIYGSLTEKTIRDDKYYFAIERLDEQPTYQEKDNVVDVKVLNDIVRKILKCQSEEEIDSISKEMSKQQLMEALKMIIDRLTPINIKINRILESGRNLG